MWMISRPPSKVAALSLLFAMSSVMPLSAQTYQITDLGTLPGATSMSAAAINNQGQVVGAAVVGGNNRPFLWRGGTLTDLIDWRCCTAINNLGQIAGLSQRSAAELPLVKRRDAILC